MSQLLAPAPAANLICLEFPTYKDPSLGGPPFGLSPAVYVEHLSHPGEELPPGGLERVAHWQPERTHEIGKGTDWVSVWRHQ
ncbi:MAG: thiol methyltransferase [Lasallia pustulata]|uniref:Thiol methyltransferase n=1 Tax=Lasallia pustulata TaxID=136370 RepID=A0A5M8PY97_9LECA|nr:MAG: thiol methyltransferase [Lasallia pustulata]